MTVHLDNPAGRLHRLLSQIKGKPPNQTVPQAWGEVLGVHLDDWAELLRLYALVASMPLEIISELDEIDSSLYPAELARRWYEPIRSAFVLDFSRQLKIQTFSATFDGESLAYLELCDDLLHRYRHGTQPTDDDLERIRAKIAELEANVAAGPAIDVDLRDFLLKHTRDMARAVREVPIRGSAGIQEAYERGLADVYLLRNEMAERAGPTRREMLIQMFAAAGAALQFGAGILELEQAAKLQADTPGNRPPSPPSIPRQEQRALPAPQSKAPESPTTRSLTER